MILERGLEGKGRRKLRDLSLDYPILFPRQANLAIQSCSASRECVLHPAQKPSQLQKPELQLDKQQISVGFPSDFPSPQAILQVRTGLTQKNKSMGRIAGRLWKEQHQGPSNQACNRH